MYAVHLSSDAQPVVCHVVSCELLKDSPGGDETVRYARPSHVAGVKVHHILVPPPFKAPRKPELSKHIL